MTDDTIIDMVNSPPHYLLDIDGTYVEVVEIIRTVLTPEQFEGWVRGNCIKYVLRNKVNNIEDLKKAAKLVEFL